MECINQKKKESLFGKTMVIPKFFKWLFFRKVIKMTTTEAIQHPNVTLIDVREPYELEIDGTVPKAINIPLAQIPEKIEDLKEMQKPIVIFCKSGNRASSALNFLHENSVDKIFNGGGFTDVKELLEK